MMPRYSELSVSRLSTCHIDLQVLFYEVIKIIDCTILEGYRNEENQRLAVARGASTLPWPYGRHNQSPSHAVDVAPYPIDRRDTGRFKYLAGFVLGLAHRLKEEGKIKHSIRWGGDWNHNYDLTDEKGLIDLYHYEIIA